jgi:hypothetical protein
MPLSSPRLRRFVRRTLLDAAGTTAPDHPRIAEAFTKLCVPLQLRLQGLFGTTAVVALFARARHVAAAEFPWVTALIPDNGGGCSVHAIEAIRGIDAGLVADGLAALLAHNIGLLNTFVGEDLILPLVEDAWGSTLVAGHPPAPKVDP